MVHLLVLVQCPSLPVISNCGVKQCLLFPAMRLPNTKCYISSQVSLLMYLLTSAVLLFLSGSYIVNAKHDSCRFEFLSCSPSSLPEFSFYECVHSLCLPWWPYKIFIKQNIFPKVGLKLFSSWSLEHKLSIVLFCIHMCIVFLYIPADTKTRPESCRSLYIDWMCDIVQKICGNGVHIKWKNLVTLYKQFKISLQRCVLFYQ